MALVLADRVRDTTTTTGTGTVTLSGTAPTGYQNFSVIGNGNTCYYTINAGSQWEVGIGTYSSTGPTLARTTVLASSNSGSLVNFSTGTKDVFVTYPAGKSVNYDASNNVGIGTTSPSFKLDVQGNSSSTAIVSRVYNGDTSASSLAAFNCSTGQGVNAEWYSYSGANWFGTKSNHPQLFITNNSERMRIDSSGNVGIGTTSPTDKLHIVDQTNAGFRFTEYSNADGAILRVSSALGTIASPVALATDSVIYGLRGFGYSSAGAFGASVVQINGRAAENFTATAQGTYLTFVTTTIGSATSAERMRITDAGNVGIGTTTPTQKLEVNGQTVTGNITVKGDGSEGGQVTLNNAANSAGVYNFDVDGSGHGRIFTVTNNTNLTLGQLSGTGGILAMYTGAAERMRIDSSGNVGIGTTSLGRTLCVYSSDMWIRNSNASRSWLTGLSTGVDYLIYDETAGVERFRITSAGNVGIGTTSPGFKLEAAGGIAATSGSNQVVLTTDGSIEIIRATGDAYIDLKNSSGEDFDCRIQSAGTTTPALTFTVNGSERMRITDAGNVGIGTTGPSYKLETVINTTSNVGTRIQNQSTTQYAGSGIAMCGPSVGAGAALYYYNNNSGGTQGAVSLNRTDVAGNYQATLFNYDYNAQFWNFFTNGSERMRINSSGNVGIGTSSPNYKLDVTGQTLIGNGVAQASPSTTDIGSTSNVIIGGQGGNALYFGQYGSGSGFAQWIQSSYLNPTTAKYNLILQPLGGSVGIGLSTPNATLHLQGIQGGQGRMTQNSTGGTNQNNLNIIASSSAGGADQWFSYGVAVDNYFFVQNGVGTGNSGLVINSNNRVMVGTNATFDTTVGANLMSLGTAGSAAAFKVNATASTQVSFYDSTQSARVGWIGTSGSSTSYNTTSDRRLKKNIQPVGDVGDKIDQIEVVSHEWTNGTDAVIPYAFIAQDLYEAAPHAVSKGDDGEEVVTEWAVDYSKLVPMLIKEVQSLRARVAQLEGN